MVIMYCTVPSGAPPHDNAGLTPPSPDRHVFANGSISESAVMSGHSIQKPFSMLCPFTLPTTVLPFRAWWPRYLSYLSYNELKESSDDDDDVDENAADDAKKRMHATAATAAMAINIVVLREEDEAPVVTISKWREEGMVHLSERWRA
jgi:hypothetical protein